ncbi:MAG: Fic family protein [Spirochaetia bacterium]|jgi:cell filamentation protein|nr:Fic family protein [Spirochaetia bacterium]
MKSGRMQRCIDYIRFNQEAEGFALSEDEEADIRRLFDGEVSADGLIQTFIEREGLADEHFIPQPPDRSFYPGTHCLVNYFNLKNRNKLRKLVIYAVSVRTAQMLAEPFDGGYDFDYLKAIHEHLFGDIYPSAGTIRTTLAAKRTEFCRPEYIEASAKDIFDRLASDHFLRKLDRDIFISDLAYYMGEVEALHPFRSGNAPATRLFFIDLVYQAGYRLDWGEADADRLLEADICAIDGDYQQLIDVLSEILVTAD